jgi:hypothetical protein
MIADPFPYGTSYKINVERLRKVLTKSHISGSDDRHGRCTEAATTGKRRRQPQWTLAKKGKKYKNLEAEAKFRWRDCVWLHHRSLAPIADRLSAQCAT